MLRRHLIFSENERPLFAMTLYDRVYVLLALPRNSPQFSAEWPRCGRIAAATPQCDRGV